MSANDRRHTNDNELGHLHDMVEALRAEEPVSGEYIAAERRLRQHLTAPKKDNLIMMILRSTLQGRVGLSTVAAMALVAAVILTLSPFGTSPSGAFADVAERLRSATTIRFSASWFFNESEEPTIIEIVYCEPEIQRIVMNHGGATNIQIMDTSRNRGLLLLPDTNAYVEMDLERMASVERERLDLIELVTLQIKTLPGTADEDLGEQEMDGRLLHGFKVGDATLWLDMKTGEIALFEKQMGGTHMMLSHFELDPADLTDADFSLEPPAGYTAITSQPVAYDIDSSGEADMIAYLDAVSQMIRDERFPATTNPMEIMSLQQQGLIEAEGFGTASADGDQEAVQAFMQSCQKAVIWVMSHKPENDWHYAGDGVTRGDADAPIAWWRPEGSPSYRVIWGDLRVTEVQPEQVRAWP